MKKILKLLGIIIVILFALLTIGYLVLDKPLPKGTPGAEADALAEKMLEALNFEAWENTETVSWTFRGGHRYEWNKSEDLVTVSWDEHEVILNTVTESGVVSNGQNYSFQEANELVETATGFFNNDSFWLCAPYKVFDPGAERNVVELENGEQGLMVTYTSGGSTPGDSYLWLLDEQNRPKAVKMWVQILPIGGLEFTWENYIPLSSGAMLAKDHIGIGGVNVELKDIR